MSNAILSWSPHQPVAAYVHQQSLHSKCTRGPTCRSCFVQALRGLIYSDCDGTGMALATLFVTMPFVARELIPILEAMDMAQV